MPRIICSRWLWLFFTKGAISYGEFKAQCISLRMFAFAAVCGGCALSLMICPPKSSYWVRYSPSYWFYNLRTTLSVNSPPMFLQQKTENETDAPDVVKQLITTRRLLKSGEDAE